MRLSGAWGVMSRLTLEKCGSKRFRSRYRTLTPWGARVDITYYKLQTTTSRRDVSWYPWGMNLWMFDILLFPLVSTVQSLINNWRLGVILVCFDTWYHVRWDWVWHHMRARDVRVLGMFPPLLEQNRTQYDEKEYLKAEKLIFICRSKQKV